MREKGVIKVWYPKAGYGFIRSERGKLFLHVSSLPQSQHDRMQGGLRCTYETVTTPRGLRAVRARVEVPGDE